jgi:predicted DNA binding CopG/RHH family protein
MPCAAPASPQSAPAIRPSAGAFCLQGWGRYLDAEEKALIEAFETGDAPIKSGLSEKRKREIEAMARATMTDERAKISLRIAKRDLVRLKSRALQEGIPYQT